MDIILCALASFLITVSSTPTTIFLAKKLKLVDNPKTREHPAHIQKRTVPRAGGLPIYLAIVLSVLIFLPIDKHLIGIILGITILLVMGLVDDKVAKFNPYLRLGLLFLAAGAAVGSGIGISFVTNPFYHLPILGANFSNQFIHLDQIIIPFNFLGPHRIVLLADIFAFFLIVSLTQIVNWSKGVDGQMPGITLTTALALGFLALRFYTQGDIGQLTTAKLAFITAAASTGFLIFNWYPAKIFPGFSGSTILAFMIAVLSILSGAKVATAVLVLGIPTVDFVYTFWRRIFAGKSPVWGDRGHLHHHLLDLGWSHAQISLFYILGSAMLGAVALFSSTSSKFFTAGLIAVVFFGFLLWLNSFYERRE